MSTTDSITTPETPPTEEALAARKPAPGDRPMTATTTDTSSWQEGVDAVAVSYFGGCPKCGHLQEMLNIGRNHFAVCHDHRVYWNVGSNLFSAWHEEDESVWRENADLLETFQQVESLSNPSFDKQNHYQPSDSATVDDGFPF